MMSSTVSAPQIDAVPLYAQVALPIHLRKLFTYRLPLAMRAAVQVGSRVIVRLGTKPMTGYVVALRPRLREGTSLVESEIKEVEELLEVEPSLSPEVIEIARWVSDYYVAPLGEVMRAALPAGINTSIMQVVAITAEGRKAVDIEVAEPPSSESGPPASADGSWLNGTQVRALRVLADEGEAELNAFSLRMGSSQVPKWLRDLEREGLLERSYRARSTATRAKRRRAVRLTGSLDQTAGRITAAQRRAVDVLINHNNEMAVADLVSTARVSDAVVATLKKKGVVEEFEQEVRRDPLARADLPETEIFELTDPQTKALAAIEIAIAQNKFAPFLLHGITGSGKTEVYIRAMRHALDSGRGAMMLVPEISLTPILSRRLRAHFGDEIAIFHSSLSRGERFDEWSRLRTGEARVVLGTRSAVFAPVANLGLIIVDEEQDASYRQEESPFYNARDTAIVRAQKESAAVVLGSATPSLESFHNAQTGKYQYLNLPQRIGERSLAKAELVDMRAVFARHKKLTIFSDELLRAVEETHARGEQSIILRNKRGYSSFMPCRACGESIECPNCDVHLTYHRSDQTIVCHYCNYQRHAPNRCLACGSRHIYYVGEGTEQVEEALRQRFPALRIARVDRDTKVRRREFEKIFLDFADGKIDTLVGTQMLAKGHDFPNVTLVGVLSVDTILTIPDFRAAERTFQLITQVAGRAGRGTTPGRVLIQSFHPPLTYALKHSAAQDFLGFYREETRHRRNYGFPPFVALALLLIQHRDPNHAYKIAQHLRDHLVRANPDRSCRVLGPARAPFARLRGEFRFHVLIKSANRKHLRRVIDAAMTQAEADGLEMRAVSLEIDPVSMM